MTDVLNYVEIPDHTPYTGPAKQFDITLESAIELAEWLATNDIVSYVSPGMRNQKPTVYIPLPFQNDNVVFPTDWVILVKYNDSLHPKIIHDADFRANYDVIKD